MRRSLLLCFVFTMLAGYALAFDWQEGPAFPTAGAARSGISGLYFEGSVFAFGGLPFDAQNNAPVHTMGPGWTNWTEYPALEGAVVHVGAGVDALNRIVIFGGSDLLNGDSGNTYTYNLVEGPQEGLASRLGAAPDTLFAWVTDHEGRIHSLGGGPGAGASAGNPNSHDAQRYDALTDTWEALAPLPLAVADAAACVNETGWILVTGGFDAEGTSRTGAVQVFDPQTGAWDSNLVPPMPTPVSGHCAVMGDDGRLYVLGGVEGPVGAGTVTTAVQVYDFNTATWNSGSPMLHPRRHFGAVRTHDGFIHAFGGADGSGGTDTSERLFTASCPVVSVLSTEPEPWQGQTLRLEMLVEGGAPFTYRWSRDGQDIYDGPAPGGGTISGADSPNLVISSVGLADSGVYQLFVSNDCGTADGPAQSVAVRAPPALPVAWNGRSIHPGGMQSSRALALDGMVAVGSTTVPDSASGQEHSWVWDLETGASTDYHPTFSPPSIGSGAAGIHQGQVVGFWMHPYNVNVNGHWYTIYQPKACWWDGSQAAFAEILLGGTWEYSRLKDIDASGSCGNASYDDASGNVYNRAFWIGNDGIKRWLLPSTGASHTMASAIDDGRQFGSFSTPYPGPTSHAAMWLGTADSMIDLHPQGASRSWIDAADDGEQVGSAEFAGSLKPILWYAHQEGWVDLSPPDAVSAQVAGVGGGLQVGTMNTGTGNHACLWSGTAESCVDLHSWLPQEFDASLASDVDVAADGTIRIVGQGYRSDLGRWEAVAWSSGGLESAVGNPLVQDQGWNFGLRSWPNPGSRGGTLSFALPRTSDVEVSLYSVDGRLAKRLVMDTLEGGEHSFGWDRTGKDGRRLPAGIYLMRLRTEGRIATGKVLLLH